MKQIIYLLQVSACTGIFYIFYYLFLRNLTFFRLNRVYLLLAPLLSFAIPALTFGIDMATQPAIMQPVNYVRAMQIAGSPVKVANNSVTNTAHFNWITVLTIIYIVVGVVFTLQLVLTFVMFFVRARNRKLMQIGNVNVISSNKKLGNSSFLHVIFVNDDDLKPEEFNQIIAHELLHIRLLHSADRILVRLIQIVLWFNPFVYLYIRSIEENHEFEVDRRAASNQDKGIYATLLFKLAVSGQDYLFNGFSKVPLKKRIAMLFNQPTSNFKKAIYVFILPVILLSCFAFSNITPPKKLSAAGDLTGLGAHPLVLINGKEYPSGILYTISKSCIAGMGMWGQGAKNEKFKKYGRKTKDGIVEISTSGKPITYLTKIQKQNLEKEAGVLKSNFYTRLILKNDDGSEQDEIIINTPGGGRATNDFAPTDKVIFIYDGKIFTEDQVAEVERLVKVNPALVFGTGNVTADQHLTDADISKYQIYFQFSTDTAAFNKKMRKSR